ncbi:MAG: efflux RND transporter periplasmic adaptor subunit [Proteobacteria bacterium]|nr:efflux RND transporter periplasmic adaptor subunit [Pseudomonadota bacterium]
MTKRITLVALVLAAGAALAGGGYFAGRFAAGRAGAAMPAAAAAPGAAAEPAGERKILYWHDPMVPGPRFDKPGKSPFMDMQLAPVYADENSDSGVKISPEVQQNLGIRTATVKRAALSTSFDAVGTVQFDERRNVAVQTRVGGYVERLAVRAPMELVSKGQPLATIFAPDWLAPQNELLALQRSGAGTDIVAAARERMRAMSIPEDLIRQSEKTGAAQARFTLFAPTAGVVAELGVREGVQVSPGTTLFRIAGLQTVWAVAEIPEAQAVRLVRGQKVRAALQADASLAFSGTLKELVPQVSASTRTLQARFEVDNAQGKLAPGMLLRLQVQGDPVTRLVLPAEAAIRTGTRAVAIVRKEGGSFEPREIRLGIDVGDQLEVLEGLHEGDEVVTSGQFLVDSEARLKAVLGAMSAGGAQAATAAPVYEAQGKVESVEAGTVTISHGPVAQLKWPAMTMGFGMADPAALKDVQAGDSIRFEFRKGGPMDWEIVSAQKTGGGK